MLSRFSKIIPRSSFPAVRGMSNFVGGKSWVPSADSKLQKVTTMALVHEVSMKQFASTEKTVPWFLQQMPIAYFRQVPEYARNEHLIAISAIQQLQQGDMSLRIDGKGEGELSVTIIKTGVIAPGLLLDQLKSVPTPENHYLSGVKIFSSNDNQLALNIYTFNDMKKKLLATEEDAKHILADPKSSGINDLKEHIAKCTPEYVRESEADDFIIEKQLYSKVCTNDLSEVLISRSADGSTAKITIASGNVRPEVLLRLTSAMLAARKIGIEQAHLGTIAAPETSTEEIPGTVTILRLDVDSKALKTYKDSEIESFRRELKQAKWLDDAAVQMGLVTNPEIGLQKAEIITALCSMLHGPLSKVNPFAFASTKSILETIERSGHFMSVADSIAQLFKEKFEPSKTKSGRLVSKLTDKEFEVRAKDISSKISALQLEPAKLILNKMLEATRLTLRTNLFNSDRYALSLRVHPSLMMAHAPSAPQPFGVFFMHGRWFNGFHCRFRDIARGGLRIVTPQNMDQYALESTRHFDEVYGLSYAQQLKNKDIPEGGAKGVILCNTPSIQQTFRFFNVRKSIRAFTDSLLDLIVDGSVSGLVDYYNKDELIYLGPDENVIPSDIDWICARAKVRGYPIPAAFMSSKRGAGFNHKEFGVTSEGVVDYLHVALKNIGIDPETTPFTLKITGGPDGDVAGNLIKIVINRYGKNVKILAVADGFGVAEDMDGLDSDELLRLVQESLPITSFNKSKLSSQGVMLDVTTEEGLARRNSMHNRVKTDAFVPAGGRPNTINSENVSKFIDEDGKPSCKVIVEGANLFLTKDAREYLFNKVRLPIVKDSSANKCGVITSSCEVAASMLLTTDEFLSIKKDLVKDVVEDLHFYARSEAELLFKEFRNYPGNLPHFCERISFAIGKVTDALTDHLATVNPQDPLFEELFPLIIDNLPKKLAEVAGDRVKSRFPVQYQRNAIASTLASRLVYNEGIHFVEAQPDGDIAERAIAYYRESLKVNKLVEKLTTQGAENLSATERDMLVDLMKKGGARSALGIF